MNPRLLVCTALLAAACATPRPDADSAAAADSQRALDAARLTAAEVALDSAKRADSVRVADSVTTARTGSKSTRTGTTPTKARDSLKLSPNIGRDSVTRPKGQMPAMDTKKPPSD